MRRAFEINIEEIGKYYHITEDGLIYSHMKKRWLRPHLNSYGYVFYCLTFGMPNKTWIFAHTLVALKYIGKPPTDKHEIDHLDENKMNNHYSNLRWRTHSENIKCSYDRGRRGYWLGRNKPSPSLETKLKMANAKNKRVKYEMGDSSIVFNSIEEASTGLNTYRKMIYLRIKDGKPFREGRLSFVEDEPPI